MIIDPLINNKYNSDRPHLEKVQEYLDQTLMNYAKEKLFAYSSRVKALNSLCEKIETGRYNSWQELDDLVACVLIIPNLSYEDETLTFLKNTFETIDIRKKGATYKSYDVFRFDSTRFIGKIKLLDTSNPYPIHDIRFEIQIRTAFEHAWSVTTHDLAYKSETIDWQILRLAAQLKSSVEQLDMISLGAKEASRNISKFKWPEVDVKIELLKFLRINFEDGTIPNELEPKDFSRTVENIYSLIKGDLDLRAPRKWNLQLKSILKILRKGLEDLKNGGFPISLSLFQIIFGLLVKENLVSEYSLSKAVFYKSDSFKIIFPSLSTKSINEFKL